MRPPSHIHHRQCAIDTVLQHEYESELLIENAMFVDHKHISQAR